MASINIPRRPSNVVTSSATSSTSSGTQEESLFTSTGGEPSLVNEGLFASSNITSSLVNNDNRELIVVPRRPSVSEQKEQAPEPFCPKATKLFFLAVRDGDFGSVETAIEAFQKNEADRPNINAQEEEGKRYSSTALHIAVKQGNCKIIQLLLSVMSSKAIEKLNEDKHTIIHIAVIEAHLSGNTSVLKLLLTSVPEKLISYFDSENNVCSALGLFVFNKLPENQNIRTNVKIIKMLYPKITYNALCSEMMASRGSILDRCCFDFMLDIEFIKLRDTITHVIAIHNYMRSSNKDNTSYYDQYIQKMMNELDLKENDFDNLKNVITYEKAQKYMNIYDKNFKTASKNCSIM